MTSNKFLDECIEKGRDFLERGPRAVASIPLDKLNKRPMSGDWSPAQVFKHLIMSNEPYESILRDLAKSLPADTTNQTVAFTFMGGKIAQFAGPGPNTPAPKKLVPSDELLPASVVDEWTKQQERMIGLIEQIKGKDINKKAAKNPFMPLFKMSAADFINIFTVHTDRHIQQIEDRAAGSC